MDIWHDRSRKQQVITCLPQRQDRAADRNDYTHPLWPLGHFRPRIGRTRLRRISPGIFVHVLHHLSCQFALIMAGSSGISSSPQSRFSASGGRLQISGVLKRRKLVYNRLPNLPHWAKMTFRKCWPHNPIEQSSPIYIPQEHMLWLANTRTISAGNTCTSCGNIT